MDNKCPENGPLPHCICEAGCEANSAVERLVSCRHCKSTDGYYLKVTTKADVQFGWDGEQVHFVTTDVKYGKRKYCMACNKAN